MKFTSLATIAFAICATITMSDAKQSVRGGHHAAAAVNKEQQRKHHHHSSKSSNKKNKAGVHTPGNNEPEWADAPAGLAKAFPADATNVVADITSLEGFNYYTQFVKMGIIGLMFTNPTDACAPPCTEGPHELGGANGGMMITAEGSAKCTEACAPIIAANPEDSYDWYAETPEEFFCKEMCPIDSLNEASSYTLTMQQNTQEDLDFATDIAYAKVDCSKAKAVCDRFGITTTPDVVFIMGGGTSAPGVKKPPVPGTSTRGATADGSFGAYKPDPRWSDFKWSQVPVDVLTKQPQKMFGANIAKAAAGQQAKKKAWQEELEAKGGAEVHGIAGF